MYAGAARGARATGGGYDRWKVFKHIPGPRARELIERASQSPRSEPSTSYPAWYLHRWHFLPEGYLSRRSAAGYEWLIRNLYNTGVENALIRKLVRRVRSARPESVVEFGCGPGRLVRALSEHSGAADVVGLDLSPYLLERAHARLTRPNARLLHASGLSTPAGEASFDVAVAAHYVGHLPPPVRPAAVSEMARVVRPGGRVIIADHSWHPWPESPLLVPRHMSWHAARLIRLQVFERIDVPGAEAPA